MKKKSTILKDQLQLEYMRIKNLSSIHSKKLLFIDSETCAGNNIISFYQQTIDSKLAAIDPNLHFDLHYNHLRENIGTNELIILHNFIERQLILNSRLIDADEKELLTSCNFYYMLKDYLFKKLIIFFEKTLLDNAALDII